MCACFKYTLEYGKYLRFKKWDQNLTFFHFIFSSFVTLTWPQLCLHANLLFSESVWIVAELSLGRVGGDAWVGGGRVGGGRVSGGRVGGEGGSAGDDGVV